MKSCARLSAAVALAVMGLGKSTALAVEGSNSVSATWPDFGPNVVVFDPSMEKAAIQDKLNSIFTQQERNQFGSQRYAILFKPGKYDADVRVGFYTQVAGLGRTPDDVTINGAVRATAEWMGGNATCNFWRSAENLAVRPISHGHIDTWAVSQGADLRRLHVLGSLKLWDGGWSSGGFLVDSKVDGFVESGSQQQWISRNVDWDEWRGGNWNMVFVGVPYPPEGHWPQKPYTTIANTPIIREKPYFSVDHDGRFVVMVPPLRRDTRGRNWADGENLDQAIPIDRFMVAQAGRDDAAAINTALASGTNVLLTPGIYHLDQPIHITRPDAVVLGMGYATLIPDNGTAVMTVDNVDGAKIGGLILDAGPSNSQTLLQIGEGGDSASHENDPTFLYDIVARCGGASAGKSTTFVTINSNHVVGDNLWLWRADHGEGAGWATNPDAHGLVVNGNDVTCYGLFVEHCQGYQTLWNGNGGRVYFYQSELPYDPPNQDTWSHDGVKGYASYKVADNVTSHQAWGLGIYSYFTAASVVEESAIEAPKGLNVQFHHMVTIRLGGEAASGIQHVINQSGSPVLQDNATASRMTSRSE